METHQVLYAIILSERKVKASQHLGKSCMKSFAWQTKNDFLSYY